ncbi:rhodanese-like domain-containing protein [Dasania marina]|uniref:rhodanese-like domain-containing protein n=1 Tax=Dasania marina TaxID=471499 RepID=UPI00037F5CA3|nr:rhodanese-like domain-containing protein [Dasania marina]
MDNVIKGYQDYLAEAEAVIEQVNTAQAIALHQQGGVIFLDVRDVRELERDGMISGAYHCARGMLEFWADPNSPYHKEVFTNPEQLLIVYCAAAWRSALATKTLVEMGFINAKQYVDGLTAWKEAGAPTQRKEKV